MPRTVSVAACNFVIRPATSFDEFAAHARAVLDRAAGADLVVLPELLTFELLTCVPGPEPTSAADLHRVSSFTEQYRRFFEAEARRRGQYVLAGSHVTEGDDGRRNVAFLFGPEGLVHRHEKTHIFPGEAEWGTGEGDAVEVIDLPFARVGIAICYEMEIPELATSLSDQGAEILLCPSYTVTEQGFWRVRHCAAARAVENQVYVVHACTGGEGWGAALAPGWARAGVLAPCDVPWDVPDGVLAQAPPNEDAVAMATLDLDALHANRRTGAATTYRDRRRRASLYARLPRSADAPHRALEAASS